MLRTRAQSQAAGFGGPTRSAAEAPNARMVSKLQHSASEEDDGSSSSYDDEDEDELEVSGRGGGASLEELQHEDLQDVDGHVELLSSEQLQARAQALMAGHDSTRQGNGIPTPIDTMLDLLIWCMPFTFLYLLLDIMIQQQYAMHPTFLIELGRLLGTAPILSVFIYYTAIRRIRSTLQAKILEAFITALSLVSGIAFLWVYAKAPYTQSTRQLPPLGTIWVFTIVRLPLPHALVALSVVAGWAKYSGIWDAIQMR